MTIGEKIQQLRKAKGISQEALAERLGISRQAISKWEGDGAIPSIDNLIELAKIFQVSVGTLLQVEKSDPVKIDTKIGLEDGAESIEKGSETEVEGGANSNPTERLNAFYSEFEEYRWEQEKKMRRLRIQFLIGAAFMAFLIIILIGSSFIREVKLERRQEQLEGQCQSLLDQVNDGIRITGQDAQNDAEEQNNLIMDYKVKVAKINSKDETAEVDITVIPKTVTAGMMVEISAVDETRDTLTGQAILAVGNVFKGKLDIPLDEGKYTLYVNFTENGTVTSQRLEYTESLLEPYRLRPMGEPLFSGRVFLTTDKKNNRGLRRDGELSLQVQPAVNWDPDGLQEQSCWPVSAEVRILQGRKTLKTLKTEVSDVEWTNADGSDPDSAYYQDKEFKCKFDETFLEKDVKDITIRFVVTDNFGCRYESDMLFEE